ncbi:hypothetical protein N7471_010421 [Penicillium samsonianum]|uniref:uncharacterized protein n=1 Tax=Penicillium samsonianum TaxID=1882272 RepID=UPI0025491190|nr:uncharacterized protein N7471_010421 [Penicillium samsonianum]KAJ6125928.1 hypothetical protein N7471_010421 [Penicillium samsonianum]
MHVQEQVDSRDERVRKGAHEVDAKPTYVGTFVSSVLLDSEELVNNGSCHKHAPSCPAAVSVESGDERDTIDLTGARFIYSPFHHVL